MYYTDLEYRYVCKNTSRSSQLDTGQQSNQYGGMPLVLLQDKTLIGGRKPTQAEWIKHAELYSAIGEVIDASHVTGLQRVNSMWRIYLETLDDKVVLLVEGVPLGVSVSNCLVQIQVVLTGNILYE